MFIVKISEPFNSAETITLRLLKTLYDIFLNIIENNPLKKMRLLTAFLFLHQKLRVWGM